MGASVVAWAKMSVNCCVLLEHNGMRGGRWESVMRALPYPFCVPNESLTAVYYNGWQPCSYLNTPYVYLVMGVYDLALINNTNDVFHFPGASGAKYWVIVGDWVSWECLICVLYLCQVSNSWGIQWLSLLSPRHTIYGMWGYLEIWLLEAECLSVAWWCFLSTKPWVAGYRVSWECWLSVSISLTESLTDVDRKSVV